MRSSPNQPQTVRPAFTLIELLVVIAIISVLMGLLIGVVMRVMGVGAEARNRYELTSLATACEKFKSKYGIYPPSWMLLSNDQNVYKTTQKGIEAWRILTKIWPNLDPDKSYDWSGGRITGTYTVELEGDQCLVFFLGGIQTESPGLGCLGFADSDTDPINIAQGKKVPPFFTFQANRLIKRSASHPFFSYKDIYAQAPYAYFCSIGGIGGQYDPRPTLGVEPYHKNGKYYNPKSFQIISAGRDGLFGPGGNYDADLPIVPIQGKNDIANFHPVQLGSPRS